MVAGNGSGDSPGNDRSSLVRAPTRAAYSFADTDRAVIFPIRVEAVALDGAAQGDDGVGAGDGPAHAAVLEAGADDVLAAPLDDAGRDAQTHRPERRVVHAFAVGGEVLGVLAGLLAGAGMAAQGGDDFIDAALVEFLAPLPGPSFADLTRASVDGLGDLEQMALGVEDVDDLDGVGEVLVGEVPDPWRAVAEHDLARRVVEAAALGLAQDAPCEGRGLGIGVAGGDGLDGGVVGGRAGVAHGAVVFVSGLRRPHDGELGLAGLGGAVGLFALAAFDFALARRHAGAVEAEVDGGGIAGLGFDNAALVAGDLAPERLGVSFHRLGGDGEAGQFAQQGACACEAGPGRGDAHHAQRRRRHEGVLHAESAITRSEAVVAPLAVIPGTLQSQRAQRGGEGLGPAPGQARLGTALAGQMGALLVAVVGVEPAGDGLAHELQRHPPGFGLDRLEVLNSAVADQALGFGADLRGERRFKPPFFSGAAGPPASNRTSHKRVLTSTNSRVRR